jgi:hypothetical protein
MKWFRSQKITPPGSKTIAGRRFRLKLGHSNPQQQIKSNVCANAARSLGPAGRFFPVRLYDPRPNRIGFGHASGSKTQASYGVGKLTVFRVLFTIGQTLPSFPASIDTPDGYPLLRLAI